MIPLLTSGTGSLTPALLPPPQHLALAATLIVHPSLTTRTKSASHTEAAILSLRYLRLILKLVGPINARLQDAFTFSGIGTSTRRSGGRRRIIDEADSPQEDSDITSELATTGALWTQVEDFWQVVGWAFNCSIIHPHRWEHWSLWLQYMLEVLEKDWETRWFDFEQDGNPEVFQNSMIVHYLSTDTLSTGHERKVVRAIFADGTKPSMAEFHEIWQNETRERRKDGEDKRPTDKKIDIEADDYGDYMGSSSSDFEDSQPPSPNTPNTPSLNDTTNGAAPLGGMHTLTLRLRLLSLLATVSVIIPSSFIPLYDLYDHTLHFIRPLPLPTFFALISPLALASMTPASAQTLVQRVLRSLISSSAPMPEQEDLEQEMLEKCYLPFAANTQSVADNAKVSCCVETLVGLYERHCGLVWSEGLQGAVEKGIEEREGKARKEGKGHGRGRGRGGNKGKDGGRGGGEKAWLRGSAERLRQYVEVCRERQGD